MNNGEVQRVRIRTVFHNDINAIVALDKKVGVEKSNITYQDMIGMDVGGPRDFSFVAEVENQIVGFIIAQLTHVHIPFIEICIINGMVVDPHYQRQQIGKKLMTHLLYFCREKKIATVRAIFDDSDIDLKQFMESLGFERSKIVNYDQTFEN